MVRQLILVNKGWNSLCPSWVLDRLTQSLQKVPSTTLTVAMCFFTIDGIDLVRVRRQSRDSITKAGRSRATQAQYTRYWHCLVNYSCKQFSTRRGYHPSSMQRCRLALLVVLSIYSSCVLSSHFRGGIIMIRPQPGGAQHEVSNSRWEAGPNF